MMVDLIVDEFTSEKWRALASTFADNIIYQTWQFGACRAAEMDAEVSRLLVRRGETVLGLAQARIKRVPLVRAGIAYIYHGPLWRRKGCCPLDLQAVLEGIYKEYALRQRLLVRLVPRLPAALASEEVLAAFEKAGFAPGSSAGAYRTLMLSLSPSLAELRKGLAQKWRNCLNQSEKRDLNVYAATNDAAMAEFERLYNQMWAKKRFETGVTVGFIRQLQKMLTPAEKLTILLSCADGEPVAGHISSTLGDTCVYLLGASNDEGRRTKASYLLQWRAIEMAKAAGAQWYDLGGIDPEGNLGVYHFKVGLNGQDCRFVGQFNTPGRGASKYLLPLAERAYRALQPWRGVKVGRTWPLPPRGHATDQAARRR